MALLLSPEAVAQTPGELAGSLLSRGAENGYLIRRAQAARVEVIAYGSSDVHFRDRGAAFSRRLYATASPQAVAAVASFLMGGEAREVLLG